MDNFEDAYYKDPTSGVWVPFPYIKKTDSISSTDDIIAEARKDVVVDANYVHTDNNFTNEYKNASHGHTNKSILDNINNLLNDKVDKINGKQLSTEDYTSVEKQKLAQQSGINTGDQDLSGYQIKSDKNSSNGYAGLDENGKVPAALLPSYVDDVIEFANFASLPAVGESGKIYITTNDNKQYRWSGSVYADIAASPGTTDSVTEGATNLYFTEGRVRNMLLTGISFLFNQAITATDSVLGALGKLQAQITALGSSKLDATLEQGKVWVGGADNKPTSSPTIQEWAVGITQPGQKEVMGLLLKMIVSDGSSIVVPIVPQKAVVLTAVGQIQLLNDAYAGKYYVIKNAYLVARNLSGVTQYPTFSIGCNGAYNDIAASQTLNTLANGVNAIALTANASKAIVEANSNMVLNITTPLIGSGTFIIALEGMIC